MDEKTMQETEEIFQVWNSERFKIHQSGRIEDFSIPIQREDLAKYDLCYGDVGQLGSNEVTVLSTDDFGKIWYQMPNGNIVSRLVNKFDEKFQISKRFGVPFKFRKRKKSQEEEGKEESSADDEKGASCESEEATSLDDGNSGSGEPNSDEQQSENQSQSSSSQSSSSQSSSSQSSLSQSEEGGEKEDQEEGEKKDQEEGEKEEQEDGEKEEQEDGKKEDQEGSEKEDQEGSEGEMEGEIEDLFGSLEIIQMEKPFNEEMTCFYILEKEKEKETETEMTILEILRSSDWTFLKLKHLVKWVNGICSSSSFRPFNISRPALASLIQSNPKFMSDSLESIIAHFSLLLEVNHLFQMVFPLIDFSPLSKGDSSPLLGVVQAIRPLLFWNIKCRIWNEKVDQTVFPTTDQYETIQTISLDRAKVVESLQTGENIFENSIFYQLFEGLKKKDVKEEWLRQEFIHSSHRGQKRCFSVVYNNEAALDYGGPYREIFTMITKEVQSDLLPLFSRCGNYLSHVGDSRDCWLFNSNFRDKKELELVSFLGKVVGIAYRCKSQLALKVGASVYRRLCHRPPKEKDLKSLDFAAWSVLQGPSGMSTLTNEEIEDYYDNLVWNSQHSGSQGPVRELIPNGNNIKVTEENLSEFIDANIQFRLSEAQEQEEAFINGLTKILPTPYLFLFSHREVESLLCSETEIDVESLRKHAQYECDKDAPHIEFFWTVMKEFNTEQKAKFLNFVYSTSSLPPSEKDWVMPFTISSKYSETPDFTLPVAHTCFFTIELPSYTSVDIMREKLLLAIESTDLELI